MPTAIRASPTCGTPRTSSSASASSSTSTSTSGPCKLYDARLCPLKGKSEADIDFTVFRENTEGAYVGIGGFFKKGTPDEVAMQEEINTCKGVERICRAAFEWAVANGKKKVTMADKSNVMRYGHDLWQRVFFGLARSTRRSRPPTCSSTRSACRW